MAPDRCYRVKASPEPSRQPIRPGEEDLGAVVDHVLRNEQEQAEGRQVEAEAADIVDDSPGHDRR